MPVLTGIDVLGIQRYVFASNRLRDSVSASWLVHRSTACDGALDHSGGDVLQASGGGAILEFEDEERARHFAARYTRRLYEEAPGLEVALVHRAYEAGNLAAAIEQLRVDLEIAKLERAPFVPQLGLSVTAPCRITGLPATGFDPQDRSVPLSRIVLRWRDPVVRENAISRWATFLPVDRECDFPPEVDDMGRTRGETSLIGVVHVDGNGVGDKITAWLRQCVNEQRSDETLRSQLAEWSRHLNAIGECAFRNVVSRVVSAIQNGDNDEPRLAGGVADLAFGLRRAESKILLPTRPVLLGGDDLTFLCDGRIALDLAETALRVFESTVSVPHLTRVTACAGVAIVPAHTPFDRAYGLAESLCRNAKRRRREKNNDDCWIDWHIGAPRPGESVLDLRARAYSHWLGRTKLELTCRPYRLGTNASNVETWRWLSGSILGTQRSGFRDQTWSQHRNKLQELASVLRAGQEGVQRARQSWTVAANLSLPGDLNQWNGFLDGVRTPLLDAIELLDVHLPLE